MRFLRNRAIALVTIASLLAGVLPARAAVVRGAPAASASVHQGAARPDSAVGVVAAIACGLGVRYLPVVVGAGAGWTAVWVGACLLMVIDAMSEKD